jgi:hypothetical protein
MNSSRREDEEEAAAILRRVLKWINKWPLKLCFQFYPAPFFEFTALKMDKKIFKIVNMTTSSRHEEVQQTQSLIMDSCLIFLKHSWKSYEDGGSGRAEEHARLPRSIMEPTYYHNGTGNTTKSVKSATLEVIFNASSTLLLRYVLC